MEDTLTSPSAAPDGAAAAAPVAPPPAAPAWTVLCVDDEPNILSSLRRLFRSSGTGWRVLTAEGGQAALDILAKEHVDLIISDMRMPGMDGAELLRRVREGWPRITRVLLTGYAEISSTVAAINEGQIHRYITKPWNEDEILLTVRQAFERLALEAEKHRLELLTQQQNEELKELNATLEQKVERRTEELSQVNDKLKKNYFNSIKAFSDMIELRGGQLVGHSRKVADVARRISQALKLEDLQQRDIFIAALLHDVGHIGLTDAMLNKPVPKMTQEELARYRMHPAMGEQTLLRLDDMQNVAQIIRAHHERFDGKGFPDGLAGEDIPIGARIIAVADAYEDLQAGHVVADSLSASEARSMIKRGSGTQFDPFVVDALLSFSAPSSAPSVHKNLMLRTDELKPGMSLAKDFMSTEGVLLLAADHVLTPEMITRIRIFERRSKQDLLLAIRSPQEKA